MVLYRLARDIYANLSGIGAAASPGRWNQRGQEALYTSVDISTPVLERLAHTDKSFLPKNLVMMHIALTGTWEMSDFGLVDQQDGATVLIYRSLAEARTTLQRDARRSKVFAAAVPSVIVPAWNVVFLPDAPVFWEHVSLKQLEPFEFDPRLFPKSTLNL